MRTLLLLLLVLPFFCLSQNHFFGINGSYSYLGKSKYNEQIIKGNFTSDPGFNLGLTYEYQIHHTYIVGVDLNFNQRSYHMRDLRVQDINMTDIMDTLSDPYDKYYYLSPADISYQYLSLPLKIGVQFGKKVKGFVVGAFLPTVYMNIKSKSYNQVANPSGKVSSMNTSNGDSYFGLAGQLELGIRYFPIPRLMIYASGSIYQHFIAPSFSNRYEEDQFHMKSWIGAWGINATVGISFALSKKPQKEPKKKKVEEEKDAYEELYMDD